MKPRTLLHAENLCPPRLPPPGPLPFTLATLLLLACSEPHGGECLTEQRARQEARLEQHELAQAALALDALSERATEWHVWRDESNRQEDRRLADCATRADCISAEHDYSVRQVPDRFREVLDVLGKLRNLVSSDRYRDRFNDLYHGQSSNDPITGDAPLESEEARVQRELSRIITTAYALAGEGLGFHPATFQRGAISACNENGFTLPESMQRD